MSMIDTYKYGSLYVAASGTIEILEEREAFHDESRDALRAFEASGAEFTFDPDWHGLGAGGIYSDGEQLPLVLIGTFGGYPGESLARANAQAAKDWAEDQDNVLAHSVWFGGCEMVELWYDLSGATATREDAQEAVELAEGFMDYPVLDEGLWSEYESEAWTELIGECVTDTEDNREITFSHAQREQIWELSQEFQGYWEEGYFPEDEWNKIIDKVLNGEVQSKQTDELPIFGSDPNGTSECNCSNPYCQV